MASENDKSGGSRGPETSCNSFIREWTTRGTREESLRAWNELLRFAFDLCDSIEAGVPFVVEPELHEILDLVEQMCSTPDVVSRLEGDLRPFMDEASQVEDLDQLKRWLERLNSALSQNTTRGRT